MKIKKIRFKGIICVVQELKYENGRTSLRLSDAFDYSPVATATVNIPDRESPPNNVFIKSWGVNTGMLKALVDAGIIIDTGATALTGTRRANICTYVGASE